MMTYNYMILDAARMGEQLKQATRLNEDHICLYLSKTAPIFQRIGPYLFKIKPDSVFMDHYLEFGWGRSWGISLQSAASAEQLQMHFSRFKMVKGNYFRYYDPRVLKRFLPACDKTQLAEFFGPVEYFITEGDEEEEAILFQPQDGVLQQRKLTAADALNLK